MVNELQEMLEKSATLYFAPWYRRSPYFDKAREAGCTAYDIYNRMYSPAYYDDPVVEYWALVNDVTMWDVAVERTIELRGPDADKLMNMITCRDLSNVAVHQGKYAPIIQRDGGIVNDPVLLHPEPGVWWMQLADSDTGLYAEGVAASSGLDVEVNYPDVYPMQVQGAKAAQTVAKLVGEDIYDLKYYWTANFEIEGIPVLISRTGWTAVQGFEINLLGYDEGGRLWD
ncbi:MAG: glycine cleavage system protein T, partial [Actinomycetota bacterium]